MKKIAPAEEQCSRLNDSGADVIRNIQNNHHQTIARLSNKGHAKWHDQIQTILHARVLGIVRRKKTDGEDYDGKHEKVESWELPIVEILHKKLEDKSNNFLETNLNHQNAPGEAVT